MFKRNSNGRYELICLLLLIVFHNTFGQKIINDSVPNIELQEVTLNHTAENINVRTLVSEKIDAETFKRFNPIDMVSSINQISGVYILSGALNTNRITIRGIGSRTPYGTSKLRMYLDGIPVTNGAGVSSIEAFDLENLENIEVIKGPKGTSLGANLGGAIRLTTGIPEKEQTSFSNSITVGSYKQFKNNLKFQHNENKFYLNLSYDHTEIDGYRENSRYRRNGFLLNSRYQLSKKASLGILVNYIDYNAQIPSSLSKTDFYENPTQAAGNWRAAKGFESNKYTLTGIHYTQQIGKKLTLKNAIFYTYLDHYEPRPFNILDEYTNGFGFRTEISGSVNIKGFTPGYMIGTEMYKDDYNWNTYKNNYRDNNGNGSLQGEQLSDNEEQRDQISVFALVNLPLSKAFLVKLGLSVHKTSYTFKDHFNLDENNKSASRDFNPVTTPSIHANYILNKSGKLYANISRGISNPSLEETLTPDGVINPDIEQETGMNYEVGARLGFFSDQLRLKAAVYRMNVKNLLVAERIGEDQYIGRNAGKMRHQGLELDVNYTWNITSDIKLLPFARYTWSDHSFVKFIDKEHDYSGNKLTGVPRHRINAGFLCSLIDQWSWSTGLEFVDRIPLTDENSIYSDSYTIWNSSLNYSKTITPKLNMGARLGINNVFNSRYARSVLINATGFGGNDPRFYYPGNSRNFYASIQLHYRL